MNAYIGIDLGTSAMKLLLVAEDGNILASHAERYPVFYPRPGWSEQNPEDWFEALTRGIPALLQGFDPALVKGIGIGGQMHGLVLLDENDEVVRPCILWNDGRTEKQTKYLNEEVGRAFLSAHTANVAFAGFTAPKVLWLKENERENYDRVAKIMLPKDYLVYRLTGAHASDCSDASGTLFFDVKKRRWDEEMCALCGVKREWLPRVYESGEKVGTLKSDIARQLHLPACVAVAAGAGDNAAAAIGTGTVKNGDCNISLGTSGTVFISSDTFGVDTSNALHSFCHANGAYHLMGCILSAASANAWWMDVLKSADFDGEQRGAEAYMGKNNVFFLPYLMGERSPHNDANAKGAFIGLHPDTTRTQLTLAVMEGVTFALKDCVTVAEKTGVKIAKTRICGGGAKSPLWRQLVADILGVPVEIPTTEEGPSYGGAILAMIACGAYRDAREIPFYSVKETVFPDSGRAQMYQERYEIFRSLYPALKDVFQTF